jgi:hypothetical protein
LRLFSVNFGSYKSRSNHEIVLKFAKIILEKEYHETCRIKILRAINSFNSTSKNGSKLLVYLKSWAEQIFHLGHRMIINVN